MVNFVCETMTATKKNARHMEKKDATGNIQREKCPRNMEMKEKPGIV